MTTGIKDDIFHFKTIYPPQNHGNYLMTFHASATLLAIDTSSPACSVAVQHHGKIYEQYESAARKHTQELLPLTDAVLRQAGADKKEITDIVISAGPGAFTGLRIGSAVAMGLAAAWQVPLLPVSSLALLAATARRLTGEKTILAMMDARMNEVYVARFEDGKNVTPECVCPPESLPPEWFTNALVAGSGMVYQEHFPPAARTAREMILPAAQDCFSLLHTSQPLPLGVGVELNYLRNEVTQQ